MSWRDALVFVVAVLAASSAARAAEKKADPGPKPFIKKLVIVVECVRRTDVKAARDFVAYLTRKLPAKPMGKAEPWTPARDMQFVAAASLSSARKTAEREKAVAIVHVKVIKRAPIVRGGAPEMRASCSVLLPTVSKTSRRVSWKVKTATILPPQEKGGAPGLVLLEAPDAFGDPWDFVVLRQGIERLTWNAAVEVAMPRVRKPPKKGETVKVTVTNNTLLDIAALDVSTPLREKSFWWSYSGDALPPGKSEVTLVSDLDQLIVDRSATPGRTARVERVRFAEAAEKK
jgi:hypothetical protein